MRTTNLGKRFPAEPLTTDEARAIFNACSKRAPTGIRNRALLVVLYRAGLRISEALALLPKDLDSDAGTLRVLRGKGKTTRLLGMDTGAWAVLQVWMERRSQLGIGARQSVFCTLAGEPMKTAYVRALLPRLARKGGVAKRVHAHGLRHSFAFELANERTPLHLVQAALGHASISTTNRYVSHLNPTAVVEAIRSRDWTLSWRTARERATK
jgi:site-specific recombinase XerD